MIGDALAGVAYVDDSQVVDGRCRKTYPGTVLNRPGALIRIWDIGTSLFFASQPEPPAARSDDACARPGKDAV